MIQRDLKSVRKRNSTNAPQPLLLCWSRVSPSPASWSGIAVVKRHRHVAILQASGAGDGLIRLWAIGKKGSNNTLLPKGALPARGFVNGLAIAKSGRFLVAAVGQEPRLGRWLRDGAAKNGTLIYQIPHSEA